VRLKEVNMTTNLLLVLGLTAVFALAMAAEEPTTVNFDDVEPGGLPKGWTAGVTGEGNPKWQVTKDGTAPSAPNVLAQTGEGTFPFCVDTDVSLKDGFVEVKFKPVSGKLDRAGSVI
jgi:hypothetical protein